MELLPERREGAEQQLIEARALTSLRLLCSHIFGGIAAVFVLLWQAVRK